ncbi:hypothetical protein IJ182_06765 [bacterium]|nr:hypothetical protein [bacterium]
MRVSFNTYNTINSISMKSRSSGPKISKKPVLNAEMEISRLLEPLSINKKAKVAPKTLMKGINPNNNDVFDTFTKIDDVTKEINFVKNHSQWNDCLMEEIEEFNVARREHALNPTQQNFDHMEEEMGDIFYTAASMAKNSGIDPKEAFKSTNRKFFNRINIMERMAAAPDSGMPDSLKDCKGYERRALWNAAKRKIYDAQSKQYLA